MFSFSLVSFNYSLAWTDKRQFSTSPRHQMEASFACCLHAWVVNSNGFHGFFAPVNNLAGSLIAGATCWSQAKLGKPARWHL